MLLKHYHTTYGSILTAETFARLILSYCWW